MEGETCDFPEGWLRGVDLNHRPLGYEPNELPDCSTPQFDHKQCAWHRQTCVGRTIQAEQRRIASNFTFRASKWKQNCIAAWSQKIKQWWVRRIDYGKERKKLGSEPRKH